MYKILSIILSLFILPIFFTLFAFLLISVILFIYITHPRNTYPIVAPLGARLAMLSGLQYFSVRGAPPPKKDGPYLFMFNHESMFDVLMLAGGIPYYINAIGWEGIFKIPLFGKVTIENKRASPSISVADRFPEYSTPVTISKLTLLATGGLFKGSRTVILMIASFEFNAPSETLKLKLSSPK